MKCILVFTLTLMLLQLTACSRGNSNSGDGTSGGNGGNGNNGGDGDGLTAFCGYNFQAITDDEVNSQLASLSGYWIESVPYSCTSAQDASGNSYCYKSGFQFDPLSNQFGVVMFKYRSIKDVTSGNTFEITKPDYSKITISSQLSGNYAGYRFVQLDGGSGKYTSCQNFTYKYDSEARRLYYTRPTSTSGWSNGRPLPDLNSFLSQHPEPAKIYWIPFNRL